jgi:hypothetical protein
MYIFIISLQHNTWFIYILQVIIDNGDTIVHVQSAFHGHENDPNYYRQEGPIGLDTLTNLRGFFWNMSDNRTCIIYFIKALYLNSFSNIYILCLKYYYIWTYIYFKSGIVFLMHFWGTKFSWLLLGTTLWCRNILFRMTKRSLISW